MPPLSSKIADAFRLTSSGRLLDATHAIQVALGARAGDGRLLPNTIEGEVIDLVPERVVERSRTKAVPGEVKQSASQSGFLSGTYTGPTGTLAYRLFVPSTVCAGMPLVVMLHGCTQTAEDFAAGTGMNALAEEGGFLVAYPNQPRSANPQGCWNWFKPGDQQRDRGEPALIAGVTRQIVAEYDVDQARVYVAGLSAGGAAAAIMGATYPDVYAAIGVHSGLACGAARDVPSALTAMRRGAAQTPATPATPAPGNRRFVPVITFHGDADRTVDVVNSRQIVAAAVAASVGAGVALQTESIDGVSLGGRRYTRATSSDASGQALIEEWTLHGGGHAWAGGSADGSYTDPAGPAASREMLRFFLSHRRQVVGNVQ